MIAAKIMKKINLDRKIDTIKNKNKNQINDKNKDKAKTFLIEKKNHFDLQENNMKKYYQSENLAYFNSNNDFNNEKEFDISILLATFIEIQCRQCHVFFSSNNVDISIFVLFHASIKKDTQLRNQQD